MTRQEKGAERRREVKRRSERRTMATLHIIRCTNWNCSTTQLQVTVNKTSGPPMLLAGSVSGRPHSKWWWCHDIGYPLLAAEHLLCKAPCSGTPCRMTSAHSKTMSPLDSAWKPGFSLATSMLSALETSWQLRYINSHLPLPSTLQHMAYKHSGGSFHRASPMLADHIGILLLMSTFQMLNEVRCAPARTLHRLLTQITLSTLLTTWRKVFPHRTFPADLPSAPGSMTFGHSINVLHLTIAHLLKQMQIILITSGLLPQTSCIFITGILPHPWNM